LSRGSWRKFHLELLLLVEREWERRPLALRLDDSGPDSIRARLAQANDLLRRVAESFGDDAKGWEVLAFHAEDIAVTRRLTLVVRGPHGVTYSIAGLADGAHT
jgi:hypothetical protein